MDLSDGLADGVAQIAEASGTGAVIDASAIAGPARGARAGSSRPAAIRSARPLAGGDDYELLFAVPRRARGRLATVRRQARGVPITRIGELTREPGVRLQRNGTHSSRCPPGFAHF